MKKILHIIPSLRLGGEEKNLLDLYPFLNMRFFHVIFPIIQAGELYPPSNLITLSTQKNSAFWLTVFKGKNKLAKLLRPFLFAYYTYRIILTIKKENPDAIITYTFFSSLASCFAKMILSISHRKKPNFKTYVRIGTHIQASFQKTYQYQYIYTFLMRAAYRVSKLFITKADCIIVVNSTLIDEFILGCKIPNNKKFFLLPNCINPKTMNTANEFYNESPFFIAAGRLEYVKGFDFLINTFSLFLKKNSTIKLIIFGEGSERAELEKLIKSHKLEKLILLPGYANNPTWIAQNALGCIVPSRSEAFGKIIIEAMHVPLIVVSSNCAGPNEIIKDKVNGFLFEKENGESLLSALNNIMLMSEEEKKTMKNNANKKSLSYKPEYIAKKLNTKLESDLV